MTHSTTAEPTAADRDAAQLEALAETDPFRSRNPLDYVPGILLLLAVGLLGKFCEKWWLQLGAALGWKVPDIEYVLWAIVIGLIITNVFGLHKVFKPGVATFEFWLKAGIVLLGARFVIGDVAKLGGTSLIQILVDMTLAGTIILLVAHWLGLSGKLGSLLAIGTSICGVSAIIAARGAIRAKNTEVGYAIAAILTLGAVSLFVLPPLGHAIGLSDHEFGLWAGLAVDNTAETTATGYAFSDEAGDLAVLVKSVRNSLIGFVVLGFALFWSGRGQADRLAPGFGAKAAFVWAKFPKFVLGFLAVSLLVTIGAFSTEQVANLGNLSRWAFLFTFAGVGLSTDIRALVKTGWRPLVVAVVGLASVAVISLGLVLFTSRVLGWNGS